MEKQELHVSELYSIDSTKLNQMVMNSFERYNSELVKKEEIINSMKSEIEKLNKDINELKK